MHPSTHPEIRRRLEQMLQRCLAEYVERLRDTRTTVIDLVGHLARLRDTLGDHATAPLVHILQIECFVILRRIDDLGRGPLPSESEIAELREHTQRIGDALARLLPTGGLRSHDGELVDGSGARP